METIKQKAKAERAEWRRAKATWWRYQVSQKTAEEERVQAELERAAWDSIEAARKRMDTS